MKDITLKDLLEAGCHFGHQSNRWNPKANGYIYGEREGVHIIDLAQTREGLIKAGEYLKDIAKSGGSVIIVGTKRQAREIVEENVKKVRETYPFYPNFYYLLERWPGGLLTNFDVIYKNLAKMQDLINTSNDQTLTKKERLLAQREHDRLLKHYGGLFGLTKLPDAIFLVDAKKELGAISEATRTGVKIVAICDTNTNPDPIDMPIPANDDAVGSLKIIIQYISDSWIEGLALKKDIAEKEIAMREKEQEEEKKKESKRNTNDNELKTNENKSNE